MLLSQSAGPDADARDVRHQDRIRLAASGPATAAPTQNATSATTMTAVATAPRPAMLTGRNGTPSRQTHRSNDRLIRMTPAKAQRLRGGVGPVDGGSDVMMKGNS